MQGRPRNDETEIEVSIIFHDFPTIPCRESLLTYCPKGISFEILVATQSDGQDTERDGMRVIHVEDFASFAAAMNHAVSHAKGKYLCFLEPSVLCTPDWLARLLTTMQFNPMLALAGNLHIDPVTERITHAGMALNTKGHPLTQHRGQTREFWPALVDQDFQFLSSACWLLRREVFLELGGFDCALGNGWESVDFCLRARARGYKVRYVAESAIRLACESNSTKYRPSEGESFYAKWGKELNLDADFFFPSQDAIEAQAPTHTELSHIERRYSHVEQLRFRHPLLASILMSLIRGATGLAKRINRLSD